MDFAGLATEIRSTTTSFQRYLPRKAINTIVTANANIAARNSAYELRLVTGSEEFGDKPSTSARVALNNIWVLLVLKFLLWCSLMLSVTPQVFRNAVLLSILKSYASLGTPMLL